LLTSLALLSDAWRAPAAANPMRRSAAIAVAATYMYTVSQKNWATFIFTVTLANVGRFLKFFQCRNQKEMAHNKIEKFSTVA